LDLTYWKYNIFLTVQRGDKLQKSLCVNDIESDIEMFVLCLPILISCEHAFGLLLANLVHIEDGSDPLISQFQDVAAALREAGCRHLAVDPETQAQRGEELCPRVDVES